MPKYRRRSFRARNLRDWKIAVNAVHAFSPKNRVTG
jgi:hypothetical protein